MLIGVDGRVSTHADLRAVRQRVAEVETVIAEGRLGCAQARPFLAADPQHPIQVTAMPLRVVTGLRARLLVVQ
jgi:hypothetical protein